jgi:nucleoside-diphosphate-sugar epimerase
MKNNKLLLTGSSGFLGKHFLPILSQDFEVCTLNRTADATINSDLAVNVPELPEVDIVVHAAGKAHSFPRSSQEEEEYFNVNLQGTVNLVAALKANAKTPSAFIFISSVAVYGLEDGMNIDENAPLKGKSAYAASKIQAENYLSRWCDEHGVRLTIFRLPLVAGPNPPGNLGAMIRGIKKGYYFRIGVGSSKRSIVSVHDVAKILIRASESGGTYNLTDGIHPSFSEIESHIAHSLGQSHIPRMPYSLAKIIAYLGDYLSIIPLNSQRMQKFTSTLTFSDKRARENIGWNPGAVLKAFKI